MKITKSLTPIEVVVLLCMIILNVVLDAFIYRFIWNTLAPELINANTMSVTQGFKVALFLLSFRILKFFGKRNG